MPVYNKLVRDKIPEIIKASNKEYSIQTLEGEEFIKELKKKLYEEMEEYINSESDEEALEELADLSELIHVLAEFHGKGAEYVESLRKDKVEKRGSFQERIFLLEVED